MHAHGRNCGPPALNVGDPTKQCRTVPPTAGTVEIMHRVTVAIPKVHGMIGCSLLTSMLLFCFGYAARIMLLEFLPYVNEVAMRERPKSHVFSSVQIRCAWLETNMCQILKSSRRRRLAQPLQLRPLTFLFRASPINTIRVTPQLKIFPSAIDKLLSQGKLSSTARLKQCGRYENLCAVLRTSVSVWLLLYRHFAALAASSRTRKSIVD